MEREREEKKRNIIIKGLNIGEEEIEEKVKEIMGRIEMGGGGRETGKDRENKRRVDRKRGE